MGKEIRIPQGIYLVGRDIPAGVYLIKTDSSARITHYFDEHIKYYFLEKECPECRVEVSKGNRLELEGVFTIQRIVATMINFD